MGDEGWEDDRELLTCFAGKTGKQGLQGVMARLVQLEELVSLLYVVLKLPRSPHRLTRVRRRLRSTVSLSRSLSPVTVSREIQTKDEDNDLSQCNTRCPCSKASSSSVLVSRSVSQVSQLGLLSVLSVTLVCVEMLSSPACTLEWCV